MQAVVPLIGSLREDRLVPPYGLTLVVERGQALLPNPVHGNPAQLSACNLLELCAQGAGAGWRASRRAAGRC